MEEGQKAIMLLNDHYDATCEGLDISQSEETQKKEKKKKEAIDFRTLQVLYPLPDLPMSVIRENRYDD